MVALQLRSLDRAETGGCDKAPSLIDVDEIAIVFAPGPQLGLRVSRPSAGATANAIRLTATSRAEAIREAHDAEDELVPSDLMPPQPDQASPFETP